MGRTISVSIGILSLLLCLSVWQSSAAMADGVLTLSPYDADLGGAIQKLAVPAQIQVEKPSDETASGHLGIISWDFTHREVFLKKDGTPSQTRSNPYETKPHVMKKLENEGKEVQPAETEEIEVDDKQRKPRVFPYETKKHLAIAGEKRAAKTKDQSVTEIEAKKHTMRLFPYETKKHLRMQGERRALLHPSEAQKHRIQKIEEMNVYGDDPSKRFPKPSVSIATTAKNLGRISKVKTRVSKPKTSVSKPKPSPNDSGSRLKKSSTSKPSWMGSHEEKRQRAVKRRSTATWSQPSPKPETEKEKNIFARVGDSLSKPFRSGDESSGTVRTELPKTQEDKPQKGFLGRVADTLTKPFQFAKPVSIYTLSSSLTTAKGEKIELPAIKTRDDQTMIDIFCRLSAQCAQWLDSSNTQAISGLLSAGKIESIDDLNERIRKSHHLQGEVQSGIKRN